MTLRDQAVQAAAKAIANAKTADRDEFRQQAAAALDSALDVLCDKEALAKIIGEAVLDYNLSDRSRESYACGTPDYRGQFIARAVVAHLKGERNGG